MTKEGAHGTLTLYRIHHHDKFDPSFSETSRFWAYDQDHALDKFLNSFYDEGEADSTVVTKIEKVYE
jgi:hypothetical protein